MKIMVRKPTEAWLDENGVPSWPIWSKGVSKFDWYYDRVEACYIIEGKFKVTTDTQTLVLKAGDFITFPAGLSCEWEILEPVRKNYMFM